MLEHRHDRLGQLLVEVVGEDVDEVGDPRPGILRPGPWSGRAARPGGGTASAGRGAVTRCRESPNSRSSTQRLRRLASRALQSDRQAGSPIATRARPERASSRSAVRPWFSTYAALASSIRLETSMPAGHSERQRLQWTHRSALARSSSEPQARGSIAPAAICRSRLACARGEAASVREAAEASGTSAGSAPGVRQSPQPLHAATARPGRDPPSAAGHSSTGKAPWVGSSSGRRLGPRAAGRGSSGGGRRRRPCPG